MKDSEIKEKLEKIKKIIDALYEEYERSISNGGIEQYGINSIQSQTNVRQAAQNKIRQDIDFWEKRYLELSGIEYGSNLNIIRDLNVSIYQQTQRQ